MCDTMAYAFLYFRLWCRGTRDSLEMALWYIIHVWLWKSRCASCICCSNDWYHWLSQQGTCRRISYCHKPLGFLLPTEGLRSSTLEQKAPRSLSTHRGFQSSAVCFVVPTHVRYRLSLWHVDLHFKRFVNLTHPPNIIIRLIRCIIILTITFDDSIGLLSG